MRLPHFDWAFAKAELYGRQNALAIRMPPARSHRRKDAGTGSPAISAAERKAWAEARRQHQKRKPSRLRSAVVAKRHAHMLGAAKRFTGLSEELQLRMEVRNISAKPEGYLVQFQRGGQRFTRWFHGLSDESLSVAIEFRDEAEGIFGDWARNAVPAHILSLLRLPAAVRGIHRDPLNLSHDVLYKDAAGKTRTRAFCFKHVPEEDAYASAIAFLEETVATGG